MTVLFSDIRGFTALSEKLPPEDVAEMLRDYLTAMTEIVFDHGGTVDKYIGDCVMALYNVPFEDPDHALKAVRTALELQERTLEVSARWEAQAGRAAAQRRRHQHRRGGGRDDGLPPAAGVHRHRRHREPRPRAWRRSPRSTASPILISEYTHAAGPATSCTAASWAR